MSSARSNIACPSRRDGWTADTGCEVVGETADDADGEAGAAVVVETDADVVGPDEAHPAIRRTHNIGVIQRKGMRIPRTTSFLSNCIRVGNCVISDFEIANRRISLVLPATFFIFLSAFTRARGILRCFSCFTKP